MFKRFKNIFLLSPEYRREFNEMNTRYNNTAVSLLSIISAILLSFSMLIGYFSYVNGETGVSEFWLVLPYHLICILLSVAAFIMLQQLRKRNLAQTGISDLVALIQLCLMMAMMLVSSHVEVPVIGIKNINVLILVMFAIGFFVRFHLIITLALELLFTLAAVILLFWEKGAITNFYPSLINLIASWAIASCAACMYWQSRKDNFISTKNLEALATFDKLTRLHNRGSFDAYMEREWNRVRNDDENVYLSLFIIDVDHFKNYNDSYGHMEGDKCLSTVAAVISESVRKNDFVARYGGEEFAVVLTGTTSETAARIAGKMMLEMQKRKIPHNDSVTPYVTFSIGCMICQPQRSGISMDEFIAMADTALYMAKNQGRNKFVIHPDASK